MPTVIRYHGSREQLLAKLYALPAALSGRRPDGSGACRGLVLSAGVALLGRVQDNFRAASEGGVNALTGQPWEPLAPSTLALRRKNAGAKTVAKLEAAFNGLPAHRRRLIRRQFGRVIQVYGDPAALGTHSHAARRAALGVLERMKPHITPRRYKTLKQELTKKHRPDKAYRLSYAAAHALILRDTGRLLNSLSPALRGGGEQVLRLEPGSLSVGTNVKYAVYHDSPLPRKPRERDGKPRLPRRQFLPDGLRPMPAAWWKSATDAMLAGFRTASFWQAYLNSP